MRVLIVEDETAAYENLVDILGEVSYDIQIAGNTESVTQTIHWLQSNPAPDLIRANKQFILARNSVTDITIWFDNRLLVTLDVETPERIYISKNKASEFKSWIVNNT